MTASHGWRRLDVRTLGTQPFSVAVKALVPALAGLVGVGSAVGFQVAVPVTILGVLAAGALPWVTTTYRVTPTHLEIRRGVFNRTTVTARLDRVRSVDLEADVFHRVLRVTKVSVGTGVDEGGLALDSLDVGEAERLRMALLHGPSARSGADEPGQAPEVLVSLDWSWLRFAPLNVANLVVALAAAGTVLSQLESAVDSAQLEGAWDWLRDRDLPLLVVVVLVVGPVLWVPVACLGYAVRWSGLTVTREQGQDGPTLRRVHGLLTRRATTLEEAKVRGVVVRRRALVGLAGGAELRVLTSGLDDNQTHLLPSAPRPVVEEAAIAVLGERAAVTQAVTRHGPRARRRQHLRHLRAVLVLVAATALSGWLIAAGPGGPWLWLLPAAALALGVPVAAATAELRYRRLGHAVTGRYLVSAAGTLSAARTALETDGIVGWRVRQSFWDRRLGLAQLTASTAAGAEYVEVRDVPLGEAVAIAASATPETLRGLTRPTCRVDPPRRSGPGQGPVTGSTAESSAAPRARRAP